VNGLEDMDPEIARRLCWPAGRLKWKLKPHQHQLYELYRATEHRKIVFHCSRRLGKSYTLLSLAAEECLRRRVRVPYAAPTQKNVREILIPTMQEIMRDCPKHLRPEYRSQDGKFVFKGTGSEIPLAGTDGNNADRMRGSAADLAILDEAGFMDNLRYVVHSILLPQLLTTNGRLILSSSSPISPSHDFVYFLAEAEMAGAYKKLTIHDDSRPEVIDRIPEWMEESGGAESTEWKREYLCELVTDKNLAIIPEMTEQMAQAIVHDKYQRPAYYDAYVGMDVGFVDLTAVVFGYYDFLNATLVIENELAISKMTTEDLARGISLAERETWGDQKPFLRVSDVEPIVINDLSQLHGLHFSPTAKDDKEAAVNGLRLLVAQKKLVIHPRCKNLIAHLKYGVWTKNRKTFERVEGFGHFDFIDALVYLVRNVRREKNPWPINQGLSVNTHFIPPEMLKRQGQASEALGRMIPGRR
jgi:hypothetical protein